MIPQIKIYFLIALLRIKEEKWFTFDYFLSYIMILIQSVIYIVVFRQLNFVSSSLSTSEFILYYIVVTINFMSFSPAQFIAYIHMDDINTGNIVPYLMKPLNYAVMRYVQTFASFFPRFILNTLLIIFFRVYLKKEISLININFFIISSISGFTILYLIQAIIGSMAIWFHDILRLRDVIFTLLLLLGGRIFPSRLLAGNLKNIVYYTPIPYIYDVPTNTFIYGMDFHIIIQLIWIIFFTGIYYFLYNFHIKVNLEYGG